MPLFKPLKRTVTRRQPGEVERLVVRMYNAGKSDVVIADLIDTSPSVVYKVRKRLGLPTKHPYRVSGVEAGSASWACRMDKPVTRDSRGRFAKSEVSRG